MTVVKYWLLAVVFLALAATALRMAELGGWRWFGGLTLAFGSMSFAFQAVYGDR